jgi:Kef-type K+ transport system membrane component KefB
LFRWACLSPWVGIANAIPLQAFAVGAALCSTSLGTIFALLGSSGLATSRLGVVLSSAAMLNDVVGLVMVQIISDLGSSSSLSAVTIIRPILVSVAFATVLPIVCYFLVKPATNSVFPGHERSLPKWMGKVANSHQVVFVIYALPLLAFVTGASYAGTSNLFSAYLAGATVSWWDGENDLGNEMLREDSPTSLPRMAVGTNTGINRNPSSPAQSPGPGQEKTTEIISD